jgi:O-antigen/teichoic acid export membrane protein
VDLGTGVNSQIIGTSTFWRFEFVSGMVLLSLVVPLNYYLVKHYGIIGAGYSSLISFSVYNTIRIIFLKSKFNMYPFSSKTLYAILLAVVSYVICRYLFISMHGFFAIFLRTALFTMLFGGSIIYFNLSPDVLPVLENLKDRVFGKKKSSSG